MERFLYHFFLYLAKLFDSKECKGNSLRIVISTPDLSIKGFKMANLALGKTFNFGLSYDPDANGVATTLLPAAPVWSVSDSTKASIVVSADSTSISLTTLAAGDFSLTVTSDTLTDTIQLTIDAPVVVPGVTTGIHIVQLPDDPVAA